MLNLFGLKLGKQGKTYNLDKVILIVLDGFGLGPPGPGNPVTSENMPFLNSLVSSYKSGSLVAAGLVVGLEWGTYGNSEVGHSAIGTGRVVVQSLARINSEIRDKKFFQNEAFLKILSHVQKNNSKVHLIGCVSQGGIHSHEGHLIGLLDFFAANNFSNVCVHIITDGEDSAPEEALKSLERIKPALSNSSACIASVGGRNFAMDRVKNWKLIKKAWDVIVHGKDLEHGSVEDYIKASYKKGMYDAEIEPVSFAQKEKNTKIEDGDGVIFFNFRNDRMKQIVASFTTSEFKEFDRGEVPQNLLVATMTNYSDDFKVLVAYPPQVIANTLGEVVSKSGFTQLRLAESEKEAHVTNFFNGGKLDAYKGEERLISLSRSFSGKDYLDHPEMSVDKITENILKNVDKSYRLLAINFANSDMVAHTGNPEATKKALEIVDKSLEKIVKAVDLSKTAVVITADHGNAEELVDPSNNEPDTQHSTANVPVIFVHDKFKIGEGHTLDNLYQQNPKGSLIDIAPTVLALLDIPQPKEMTGSKLVS